MSEPTRPLLVDHAMWALFFDELGRESERAAAILAAAWIDHLLERKLAQISSGNKEARTHFSTFSAKIAAAFCAGWLDADVHHDLCVLKRIRNEFAHQIQGLSMESPSIKPLIESFKVQHREFYDWGKLRCAATGEGIGIAFYTDQPAEKVGEPLVIPAAFTFRLAVSWIIAFLAANLGIGILVPDEVSFDDPENSVESSDEI